MERHTGRGQQRERQREFGDYQRPGQPAPSFKSSTRLTLVARHAGAQPKISPEIRVVNTAPIKTGRLSATWSAGTPRDGGTSARKAFKMPQLRATPRAPPARHKTRLSVSSCPKRIHRLAPSAARTAISF